MDAFDTLTQYSSEQLDWDVPGVPASTTITKAYWMLKAALSDADNAALVSLAITSSPTASGQITNTGASGTGHVDFVLGNSALASITDFNATYYATVKVVLSNANVYTITEYPVKVIKAGVVAVS